MKALLLRGKIWLHMIDIDNPARSALSLETDPSEVEALSDSLIEPAPYIPASHVTASDLTEACETIMRLAQRLFEVPGSAIVLSHARGARQHVFADTGKKSNATLESDLCALDSARSSVRNTHIPDVCNFDKPVSVGGLRAVFYAGAPLIGKGGYRFGTLCLLGPECRRFGKHEVASLMDLAAVAATNLESQLPGALDSDENSGELQILPAMDLRERSLPQARGQDGAMERQSDERYQSLLGLLSDWHWEQDESGRFILIAQAGKTKTPERFKQYIGKTFFEIPSIRMPDKERRKFNFMTSRQQPFQEVVLQWNDPEDRQRYLSISGQPIFNPEGRFSGYRGVTKDVTDKIHFQEELARSNAALRELSEAQQAFREAERKRIAHELHDELAQLLATSRMELCLLQRDLKPASSTHKRLDTLDRMIGSSIVSLRKLATDLRPSSLDEGELFYALRSLLKTVSENAGFECDLIASEADLVMDEARSTAIFRLIEECITNIGRHANAKKAVIQINRCGDAMEIRVQDDGRGIRREEMQHMKTVGLIEMRERVLKMNGKIDIKGLPGKGTRIAVSLPNFFDA